MARDTTKDPAKDILSVMAKPVKSTSMTEKIVYEVTQKGFLLRCENTEVAVMIN
jgi:hypothetical protein